MRQNIILIGYMGCGKTTIGKRVASELDLKFCDTDYLIEKIQKCTISEIFATKGEAHFRDLETKLLEQLLEEMQGSVLSTGGGLPIRKKNALLLKQLGTVIYLKASEEAIYDRVKEDKTRPLLQCENPKQKIKEMLNFRHPYYLGAADIVIDTSDKMISEVIKEIKRNINTSIG